MNIEKILQDYRDGDEEQRLHLFLQHRDLRDQFMAIHQQKARSGAGRETSKAANSWRIAAGHCYAGRCLKALQALLVP